MRRTRTRSYSAAAWVGMAMAAALVLCPHPVGAQQPVRSFDQLDTRLKAGDTIWVTDAQGREVKGKVLGIDAASLKLEGSPAKAFAAADVRVVQLKRHENLKGGTLVGLFIGLGFGIAAAAVGGCEDGGACLASVAFSAGVGAGIGCGIDALIPENRRDVVFSAQTQRPSARVSVAPVLTPRTRGFAVSFAF